MKHLFPLTVLCASAVLLTPTAILAKKESQNIDFGDVSCGEFLTEMQKGTAEEAGIVLMWIDGYLSGVSGDTVLNWKDLEQFSTELVEYCEKNQKTGVLDAAEEVGIEEDEEEKSE